MILLSAWSSYHVFSMEEVETLSNIGAYDRMLGEVPLDQITGGFVEARRSDSRLLTKSELDLYNYKASGDLFFPLFACADLSWKSLSYDRLKKIVDNESSSDSMRRNAFNRLSFAMENIFKNIYVPSVEEGEEIFILNLHGRSMEENEAIVSIVRLLAKVTLWDCVVDPDNPVHFNSILTDIFQHQEIAGSELCRPYIHYLIRIDGFLQDAIKIQDSLIETYPTDEHTENGATTINSRRRIKGVLIADRARVLELMLLKRKIQQSLDLKRMDANEIVDPDGAFRKNAYRYYHDALSQGASKSCLLSMIKLIKENGYSPTGDIREDRKILSGLLERYTKHLGGQKRSSLGIFGPSEKNYSNKVVGAIPKPQRNSVAYIEELKLQFQDEASFDYALAPGDSFLMDGEAEVDLTAGSVIPVFSAEESSAVGGISSSSRLNGELRIDTHLAVSEDSMESRSSTKSKHLSTAKREEIRTFFGSREEARERYGSCENAYREIAQIFRVTKSQVEYATYGQYKYQETRAQKQALSSLSGNELPNDPSLENASHDVDDDEEWNPSLKTKRKRSQSLYFDSSDDEL